MNQFGEKIRNLRELNGLLQRDVAQELAIDAPMLSKIEKGERSARREQVIILSKMFKTAEIELLSLWLADKLYQILKDEAAAKSALTKTEKLINRHINKSEKLK